MRIFYLKKYLLLSVLLLIPYIVFAQTGSITGKVIDENKMPLPGASISIVGTTQGAATGNDGEFTIKGVKPGKYTVEAKFIGYAAMQSIVTVTAGNTVVDFNLKPDSKGLAEVVVIGYGTQRKKDLTGSITTVSSKDFQKGNITTPEQLIAGKVAGVSITSNSGAPGAGSTIRIRGGASLNASNDPLIVIDGVQLSNDKINGSANPLSLINPNDIETFTVLKDASATAIYGSRASNGVILITTKKGSNNTAPVVGFSTQFSASKLTKEVSVLTADQLRAFVKTYGTPASVALLGTANTDWQKQIYQTGLTTDNNLSVSGGTKHVPYRVSVGYMNQDGILKTGNLERTSGSIDITPRFFDDHLKVDINVKGTLQKSRFANEGAIGSAVSFDPTQPVTTSSKRFGGYFEYLDNSSATGLKALAPLNPVGLLNEKEDRSNVQRSIGNAQFDYKFHFLPDLHANLNLGYDVSQGKGTVFVTDSAAQSYHRFPIGTTYYNGVNTQYKSVIQNTTFEFYLNYVKDIKSINSRIDLIGGYAFYDYNQKDYNYNDYSAGGVANPTAVPNYPYNEPEHALRSLYGRLNYTFMDRYLLTATIRQDESSRFSPNFRKAVFPSGSLGWKIKDESFLKESKTISDLKLRVGYGITGQQDGIDNYSYISYYNLSDPKAQYQFGSTFYQLYRPGAFYSNRKWEQSATTNLGVDYGFFDNRITGSIDAYYKTTKDLLNLIGQPAGSNFGNQIVANIGSMENKGIEFSINTVLISNKDVNWNLNFNATYNENKITKLNIVDNSTSPGSLTNKASGGTGNYIQINSIGYPRNSFYVYQQVYGSDGKPLDGVYVDRNGDGQINEQDLYRYKSPDPKAIFGMSSNVNYKKLNAGFSLRANVGNYAYNNVFSGSGTVSSVIGGVVINNASSSVYDSGLSGKSDKNIQSDYYVQNASFLRMDNVNLGYSFGKVFHNKADFRISANVQNVFIITQYKGVDPEVNNNGIDNNFYPRPRTYVLGLNLNF